MKKKPHEIKLLSDTSLMAEKVQLEILRKRSIAERLHMVSSLNNTMRTLMLSGISLRHPHFTEKQRRRMLMDLLLGESLAERIYGPPNYEDLSEKETDRRGDGRRHQNSIETA